jgi:hypothetical protein
MTRSRAALGAHVSIAGGLPTAIERADELACETAQIFVKNNNRWLGRDLLNDEVEAFRAAREASRIGPIVAHATYLINQAIEPESSAAVHLVAESRERSLDSGSMAWFSTPGLTSAPAKRRVSSRSPVRSTRCWSERRARFRCC